MRNIGYALARVHAPGHTGMAVGMSVTDPDVPDPLNDPRTLQADPGAYGEGEDLASTEDDPAVTGDEQLDAEANSHARGRRPTRWIRASRTPRDDGTMSP